MARLLAVLGVAIISFSAIFVRLAEVSPSTSAFFRVAYAVPFLWLLVGLGRGGDRRSTRVRVLAFVAGLLLGLDLAVWHRAIDFIGAGLSTVLGNTQVVFVGLLAWWIHGERPSRAALVGVPVVFAGVVLISGLGRSDAYGSDPELGTLFGVLTGVLYALFLLVFRAAGRGKGPPAGPLFDATVGATLAVLVVGGLDGTLEVTFVWPAHGWLLALAVASQVVGWLLIGAALPRLPALETSVLLLLQPTLTVLWARLIFAEGLAVLQGIGIVLVLGGVGWLSARGSVAEKTSPPETAAPEIDRAALQAEGPAP